MESFSFLELNIILHLIVNAVKFSLFHCPSNRDCFSGMIESNVIKRTVFLLIIFIQASLVYNLNTGKTALFISMPISSIMTSQHGVRVGNQMNKACKLSLYAD